jgi:hypothetical protein
MGRNRAPGRRGETQDHRDLVAEVRPYPLPLAPVLAVLPRAIKFGTFKLPTGRSGRRPVSGFGHAAAIYRHAATPRQDTVRASMCPSSSRSGASRTVETSANERRVPPGGATLEADQLRAENRRTAPPPPSSLPVAVAPAGAAEPGP